MSSILTVDQSFQKLLANLNPTDRQLQQIQKTRHEIDRILSNDTRIHLNTEKQTSFLTGSYARSTIIRPIHDIDLYVRVHFGFHAQGKAPISVLKLMASTLRNRYPRTTGIRVDAPCVIISFWGYKYEIVPAVGCKDDPDLYYIPAPGARGWMRCYPHVPAKWLSSSNYTNNRLFTPMIKILKQWNRVNKVGLKSFHLELLTERVFGAATEIYSYPRGILDWLYWVRNWIGENQHPFVLEPGKNDTYVDEYLYENLFRLRVVRRKLEAGLKRAERAWHFYTKGRYQTARFIWHQMFGPKFPVPKRPFTQTAPVHLKQHSSVVPNSFLASLPTAWISDWHQRNEILDALSKHFLTLGGQTPYVTKSSIDWLLNPKGPFRK